MLVKRGGYAYKAGVLKCFAVTEEYIVALIRLYVILNGWEYFSRFFADAALFKPTANDPINNEDHDNRYQYWPEVVHIMSSFHANVTGQRTRHLVEGTLDPLVQKYYFWESCFQGGAPVPLALGSIRPATRR